MNPAMLSPGKARGDLSDRFNLWQLLTVISWLIMSLAWIVPAWSLISGDPGSWQAWLIFALTALAAFGGAAGLALSRFKQQAARFILALTLILSLGAGWRGLVFVGSPGPGLPILPSLLEAFKGGIRLTAWVATTAAVVYLWRKGAAAWGRWIGPLVVRRAFISGVILFMALGLLSTAFDRPLPIVELFLFLFAGLLANGGARLSAQAHVRGGRGVPLTRAWVLGVGGSALGLLLISGLTAFLAGGPAARLLTALFGRLFQGLVRGLLVILEPLAYLIIAVWNVLLTRFGLGSNPLTEAPQISAGDQIQEQLATLASEVQPPVWAADLGRIVAIIGGLVIASIVIALIVAALRQWSKLRQWRMQDEPELSGETILDSLRTLLGRGAPSGAAGLRLHPARRWLAAARIRWIYSQLLRSMARVGLERTTSETPLEYLERTSRAVPAGDKDLASITTAYQRVRYGERPETRAEIDQVEAAWERFQRIIRGRKGLEENTSSP